jgi:ribosomal protein L23
MNKHNISFSMIKKFAFTEKSEGRLKTLNKVVIITDENLCKFSVMALFESIGCKVLKINSCLYKPEKKIVRNKRILVGGFKKFIINFANDVDIVNIVKDIHEKKINFLY